MKKYLLLFLVLIIAIPFAVNAEERTLITGEVEHGGCGGPVLKLSIINNTFCVLTGGYGGWIINHTFLLGGGGYALLTDVFVSGNKLYMAYGGVVVEYIGFSDALVHFKAGGLIGVGTASYSMEGIGERAFFVLEPGVDVEVNITTFFRVCAGVSYRFVIGSQGLAGLNDALLGGPAAEIALKFGAF